MGIKCNSVHIMPSTEQVLNKMAELSPSFREASFCQGSEDNQSKGNSQLSRRTLSATTSYHLVWDRSLTVLVMSLASSLASFISSSNLKVDSYGILGSPIHCLQIMTIIFFLIFVITLKFLFVLLHWLGE